MLGKIIGGIAGAKAANHFRSIGGPTGAVLGTLAVPVVRRLRLPALLALGAGAYAAKKLIDRNRDAAGPTPPV